MMGDSVSCRARVGVLFQLRHHLGSLYVVPPKPTPRFKPLSLQASKPWLAPAPQQILRIALEPTTPAAPRPLRMPRRRPSAHPFPFLSWQDSLEAQQPGCRPLESDDLPALHTTTTQPKITWVSVDMAHLYFFSLRAFAGDTLGQRKFSPSTRLNCHASQKWLLPPLPADASIPPAS
jgi:hypothetical protein